MAFNNSIALATKYAPLLDEVYKKNSLSAVLDTPEKNVLWDGADTVKLFKVELNGFGDYSRNAGYVDGSVTGTWGTYQLTQDRGRRFLIDTMDNNETLGLLLPSTMGEFVRTREVPEIDAYRFAKYASAAITAGNAAQADITVGTTDVPAALDTAAIALGDNEVPEEGRLLFVSETAYAGLKQKISRSYSNEGGITRQIETFDNMRVIRVPKGRFATSINLYDGTSVGETDGGYVIPAGSYNINFMIVHPGAVMQVVKHRVPKLISPEANQDADGWLAAIRMYHDAFIRDNGVDGIYVHYANTANT